MESIMVGVRITSVVVLIVASVWVMRVSWQLGIVTSLLEILIRLRNEK